MTTSIYDKKMSGPCRLETLPLSQPRDGNAGGTDNGLTAQVPLSMRQPPVVNSSPVFSWAAPLLILASFVCSSPAFAETKTIVSDATYIMGDGESPSFAEAMVLQKAKQLALEEAGTYVESYTKTINQDLTKEEIQTLAGGVLEVEVIEKTRTLVSDGLRVYLKIKATVTTDQMEELARRIKGKNVAEEYKKLQEDYASLSKEIESLKQRLAKSTPGAERDAALVRIQAKEQSFTELQRNEVALFQRLVSGITLAQRARDEKALFDDLAQTITKQEVQIGEVTSRAVLDGTDDVQLIVPLTISLTENDVDRLRETVKALDGTAMGIASAPIMAKFEAVNFLSFSDPAKLFESFVRAVRVFLSRDLRTGDYLREQVRKARLVVTFLGKDQTVFAACVVPASYVGVVFNAPLVVENKLLRPDRQLDPGVWGHKTWEQYLDQSQEWQAWAKSEAAFGPLAEKYSEDFGETGIGPLSSIGGLRALSHRSDLQAKISVMPAGSERMALDQRLSKLAARLDLLDKLFRLYEKNYGGDFVRLFGEKEKSRFEELDRKAIFGDENAAKAKYDGYSILPMRDAVVVARETGRAAISLRAPVRLIGGLSQVTARFQLEGTEVKGFDRLYEGKSLSQKEALHEIVGWHWTRVTAAQQTELSTMFREKGMMPLDAILTDSEKSSMDDFRHPRVFCAATS